MQRIYHRGHFAGHPLDLEALRISTREQVYYTGRLHAIRDLLDALRNFPVARGLRKDKPGALDLSHRWSNKLRDSRLLLLALEPASREQYTFPRCSVHSLHPAVERKSVAVLTACWKLKLFLQLLLVVSQLPPRRVPCLLSNPLGVLGAAPCSACGDDHPFC